jgi:hypothetical protein
VRVAHSGAEIRDVSVNNQEALMAYRPAKRFVGVVVLVAWALASVAMAQGTDASKDYCVRLTAAVQASPPRIALRWLEVPGSKGYTVSRRPKDGNAWTLLASLGAAAVGFADPNVEVGAPYEYKVLTVGLASQGPASTRPSSSSRPAVEPRSASGTQPTSVPGPTSRPRPGGGARRAAERVGYILSGIEVPLTDCRGKVILVVEAGQAAPLAKEIQRLEQDLAGDGWEVLRHEVKSGDPAPSLREQIQKDYRAEPNKVKAVFLLGHVPVVRSGNFAPDGHPERRGAQPADVYFADMDGVYTDTTVNTAGGSQTILPENANVPGDGRFDQGLIPGTVLLQLGRVDFSDLPAFKPRTEADLLRQYLHKDHNFRHKAFSLQERCLFDDDFGVSKGPPFATSAWRSCSPMFGPDRIYDQPQGWLKTLCEKDYLWAYACAGSGRTNVGGIVNTAQMVQADPKAVFLMLLGSYFVDWDVKDNVMRAMLAGKTYTLTAAWAGIPQLDFHHMALGETAGYSVVFCQKPQNVTGRFAGYVHISLMGDPTLRMHVVAPAKNLAAIPQGPDAKLKWDLSADKSVLGYHVYRSAEARGPYVRLTKAPVVGCAFTDAAATVGTTYMVRAVALQVSASGSYYNASQGVFATAEKTAMK